MLNSETELHPARTANAIDTQELLRSLGRFPAPVLPIGVLRELQSRGDQVHDSLVALLGERVNSMSFGLGSDSNSNFFAFALLVPVATSDDRPLIESMLTLSEDSLGHLIGDLVTEAMPSLIANFFIDQSDSEVIDWLDRLADHPQLDNLNANSIFRAMTKAVASGHLNRTLAIDALVNRLKKRANLRYDLQSALVVYELMTLSAHDLEDVDAIVRASFERDQIETDFVNISSWENSDSHARANETWEDPAAALSTWCYSYVSDSLEPVNATIRVNERANRRTRLEESSVSSLIDQLRQSTDENFPRDAVRSINGAFADAYRATIELIREEVARYHIESNSGEAKSWSGNGAYLGLVLTIAHRMPVPTDLLETILRMPQADREKVFGDQFGLIVQMVAQTPLHDYEFIDKWIWDADRGSADRREMVYVYAHLCCNNFLDRELAINALVVGLRRALLDEPILIAPYAESLAYLTPKDHAQLLVETFAREDITWSMSLQNLRQMVQDAEFAKELFRVHSRMYRSATDIVEDGVMFGSALPQEKSRKSPPVRAYEPEPKVISPTTIRNDDRTPRNAVCPCGSGKKFKKCCRNMHTT